MKSLARAAVVLALVGSACGSGGGGAKAPAAAPTTVAAPPSDPGAPPTIPTTTAGTASVPEALRFTAAGVDGAQVVGADYAGKDVALWFWAPW